MINLLLDLLTVFLSFGVGAVFTYMGLETLFGRVDG